MELHPFESELPAHIGALVAIWNAACGPKLAITQRGATFNTRPVTGGTLAGRFAVLDGRPAGFALAKSMPGTQAVGPAGLGWADAVAVAPEHQRNGVGSALMDWAEGWLVEAGHTRARLGGSLRPFAPGLPDALGTEGYFRGRGYDNGGKVDFDLSADLEGYRTPGVRMAGDCAVRPAVPGEEGELAAFLEREFPGRWAFEFGEALRSGSRISDYVILVTSRGFDGFLHTTYEDSYWPLDRVFPQRMPHPWAQVGPLGVSRDLRGAGYGGSLMDGALRHLRGQGIRGCVIDWTGLVEFYGKFGFKPYTKYIMMAKIL